MLFLLIVIPFDCSSGIRYRDQRFSFSRVINKAQYDETLWDPVLEGSFCPPESGKYLMKFTGYTSTEYESTVSIYHFYGNSTKSRTSQFNYLRDDQCYYFYILHSVPSTRANGNLYFQMEGKAQFFANSTNCYSCPQNWCKNGLSPPHCEQCQSFSVKSVIITGIFFIGLFVLS